MSDAITFRNTLIAKIMAQYTIDSDTAVLPVVSLEDFFEQNSDRYSLAPNVADYGRPPLAECFRILLDIRQRPDVQDVLVAIHECPFADDVEDVEIWPDSDTVYILTSASDQEVRDWAARLLPSEIGHGWSCNTGRKPAAAPDLQPGMHVAVLWWD